MADLTPESRERGERVDIGGVAVLGELFFLELFVVATRVVVRIGTRQGESRSARCCALHAS
ncbi:hypothetical protein U3A55_04990 [Salarchaeum sp. III]|uniref:hypothetical protein n=1 Tax=Salarchaeum sp. III TaxID=3107927 RepID=UPI002ED867DA